ncbi:MAG: hypothetical protein ABSC05_30150, partial [Candidatus Solibacter sp.]
QATIDLSFYHTNSGILLQFWAGFVITFAADGSPQFVVRASDGMYQVTQQYPVSVVSRTCWKPFNDGAACPYAAHGGLQTSGSSCTGVPFQADPSSCDYYFDSANGCQAHGMAPYFGGHPAQPQGVSVKDNSTGTWGFGRNNVTATSIVSDSIWGNAIQEIWCNDDGDPGKAFMVKAMIVAGRDESDFYDALGIVGAGPIGSFTGMLVYQNADGYRYIIAPMLDGQTPQGFKVDGGLNVTRNEPTMGLREVAGNDPVNPTTDSFSLGQGSPQVWGPEMAAGTAFVEIRRTDASGIQPTTADSHDMEVPISQGLTGWTWDQSGNRSAVSGLTNPFWIAVNALLRALAQRNSSSDAQLAHFVLSSVCAGDGSGASEIADDMVDAVVGGGTEKQFRFQGVLAQQKPFRDWLTEILACGLGYFTWEFGKLKLGCRINASAAEAFTIGNFLLQSLRLEPIEGAFEHLVIDFADQAYQYQANTAEYQDKSHAAYYGRTSAPLTARQHLVGCGTLSQALRLAAVRTREEIGGINPAEWRNARNVSWKTTVLALNTEVGQVVSITHPDVPGMKGTCTVASGACGSLTGDPLDAFIVNKDVLINGTQCTVTAITTSSGAVTGFTITPAPADASGATFQFITGDFRIQSWRLNKDWSVDITARTVTASMYDLTVGPKPLDVAPAPLPVLFYAIPFRPAWAPYQVQAPSTDALFPNEWTFDLSQVYNPSADGNAQASITAAGKLPVNSFIPNVGAPNITSGSITQATTGGWIKGGTTLRVAVCAIDAMSGLTPPSQIVLLQFPVGTDTNSFTLSGIIWPAASGLTGYVVFMSTQDDLICYTHTGNLTASGGSYTPTSITCIGPVPRSTWALPNNNVAGVELKGKLLVHGGVLGARVDTCTGSTIVAAETIDAAGTDNWAGRVLAIIGRYDGAAPYVSFSITAFNAATGTFTLATDAAAAGVLSGDAFVVCFKGYDNRSNPLVLTDAGLLGAESGHGGLIAHAEKGLVIRVIAGTNRGATAKVVDNTTTAYTLDQPLLIDSTSVWIVEDTAWSNSVRSDDAGNANYQLATSLTLPTTNFLDFSMLVGGFTENTSGLESSDASAPVRMVYIYGNGYVQAFISDTTYAMKTSDHVLTFQGVNQTLNLQPSDAIRRFPRYIIHAGVGPLVVNPAYGDTVEGIASVTLNPGDRMVLMPSS